MDDARVKFFEALSQRCLYLANNKSINNEIDIGLENLYGYRWINKPFEIYFHECSWSYHKNEYKCVICHKHIELEQVTIELPVEVLCTIFEYANIQTLLISTELRTTVIPRIIEEKLNYYRTNVVYSMFNETVPGRYTLATFDDKNTMYTVIYDLLLKKQRLVTMKRFSGCSLTENVRDRLIKFNHETVYTCLYSTLRFIVPEIIREFPEDWTFVMTEQKIDGIIRDNFLCCLRKLDTIKRGMYLIATALELELEIPSIEYFGPRTKSTVINKQFREIIKILEPLVRTRLDY